MYMRHGELKTVSLVKWFWDSGKSKTHPTAEWL